MTDNLRSAEPASDGCHSQETTIALSLLAAGVPLTLLLDLATPIHSHEIYVTEAGTADWLHAGVA
jgi:hypothetical protein